MKKTYDIKFPARNYTTAAGEEKTYWSEHGTLFVETSDDRLDEVDFKRVSFRIKMDSLPVSKEFDGWFRCYEKKQRDDDVKF